MGRYQYADGEKAINKVLKYQQDQLADTNAQLQQLSISLNEHISDSEDLLRSLGYPLSSTSSNSIYSGQSEPAPATSVPDWDSLLAEAEAHTTGEVELEHLLTEEEFQRAYSDLDRIDHEFQACTGLDQRDIAILVIASALQTLRWVLAPKIGNPHDPASRIDAMEGDKLVKQYKKEFVARHKRTPNNPHGWSTEKKSQGHRLRMQEGKTWQEILESGVPYDSIKGTAALGLGMSGKNHRCKTLGHDPVLGWVFGTSNILTDTITLTDLQTFRVQQFVVQPAPVLLPILFTEAFDRIQSDPHLLPAALFRQMLHYASDIYTKDGLPVPLLGTFNESLAGELYANQYDFLCFARDAGLQSLSALLAILINMVIGLLHGLYYDAAQDGRRDLYEVRTRKILLYSNALATTGNAAVVAMTRNAKLLDIGGTIVTVSRLYSDARFIARAKEQFVQQQLNKEWERIFQSTDELLASL